MDMTCMDDLRDFCREIDVRLYGGDAGSTPGDPLGRASALASALGPGRRAQLSAAMAQVARLLRAGAVRVGREPADSSDARWCMHEYVLELERRFDAGFDPARSNPADVETMRPPHGAFVVARLDGAPIGCGALKSTGPGAGEIKRMWVCDSARGLGVGRRIVAALEAEARGLGMGVLRLETNRTLKEAIALYRSCGFREVPAFNDEPYAHHWFEKVLEGDAQDQG